MTKLNENILLDELENGAVLLDSDNEKIIILQERELLLLKKSFFCTVSDLIQEALNLFQGEEEEICNDIIQFFSKLEEEGFVVSDVEN